ncbi:winged helix-turn-helix transcriptional regulator [Fodinicola feengrottensis]|uniref:Helix-turn-helix domain-containing protein n=1 Tax=Fodinicola feengrottensis TaxID=435914 RepID=A0ABN2HEP3_9ACTN|nr:helix-turn-helix domain-containing protein [Fodinicola feengrottensis]
MDTVAEQDWKRSADLVGQYLSVCPARTIVEVLANKWTMLVMSTLQLNVEPMRFNELRRRLQGLTQKVLTQTLRTLERDGLVTRTVYPTMPPRVEYSLTRLGLGAADLLHAVGHWADLNVTEILAARTAYDERASRPPEPIGN